MRHMIALAAAAFILLLGVAEADAQYTATVLSFEGRMGRLGRRAVEAGLRREVDLVDHRQVEQSAEAQGVDLATEGGMSQVAASDGISLFIGGSVEGRGRRATTTIIFYGPRGQELARAEGGAPRGRRGVRSIADAAQTGLATASAELDRLAEEARARETAANQAELAELAATDTELPPSEEEEDDEGEPEEGALPLFEIVVGFGGRYRMADVKIDESTSRVYSATFGEVYGRATVRPFGPDGGMLAGLFASLDFAYALGLSSVNEDSGEAIDTNALRVEGDVGFLLGPFGPLRVGPVVGFGYDSFSLSENPVMPTADYAYLRVAGMGSLAILDPFLSVSLDAGLRVPFSTGDLAPFFGESASSIGFDAGLEVSGNLDFGLTYGGRFAFQSFGLSFEGAGTNVTALDGTDLRLIFLLFAGYRL